MLDLSKIPKLKHRVVALMTQDKFPARAVEVSAKIDAIVIACERV